jgi:UDPglucose 6-dehydrogenase
MLCYTAGAMEKQPVVTILGTGYVGLTTAALTAAIGLKTYVVDPNEARLNSVRQGKSFFYEAGLDALVAEGVKNGLLVPTASYAESVPRSDIVFSSVGTPDKPDGSSNLEYVFSAATEAAQYLKPTAVYVQKSTVPVGTGRKVQQLLSEQDSKTAYVSNPEFLREGTALLDSLWFDRVVVGGDDVPAMERVLEVYRQIQTARQDIARRAQLMPPGISTDAPFLQVSLESAELIKVTSNAFLALKISFANSIAQLADAAHADVNQVLDVVGMDTRINQAFLQAGRGYGGGCFPKDVAGLIAAGREHGVELDILQAAQQLNDAMPEYVVAKLRAASGGSLRGSTVAVLGLAFKAGTSDARRSPGVAIARLLLEEGATVRAYDPQANHEAAEHLPDDGMLTDSLSAAIDQADATIIATDWPEFVDSDPRLYAEAMKGKLLVDAMNRCNRQAVEQAGLTYIGVGR